MNWAHLVIIFGFIVSFSFASIYALEVEEFSDTTNVELSSKTGNPSDDKKSKVKEAHKKVTDFMKDQTANIDKKGKSAKSSFDSLPILGTYTDEATIELVIVLDNELVKKPFGQYKQKVNDLIGKDTPFRIMKGTLTLQTCDSQENACTPIWGGIEMSGLYARGTLTLPFADTDGKIGFIVSGHVVRDSSNPNIWQPQLGNEEETDWIGSVITDPDNDRQSDSAFVEINPGISMAMKIYKSPNQSYNVVDAKSSAEQGISLTIHKMGIKTGETSGGLVAKDLAVFNHEDYVPLENQHLGSYTSEKGDSGAPVFEKTGNGNDVNFLGIHLAVGCFVDIFSDPEEIPVDEEFCESQDGYWAAMYSPWDGIKSDLDLVDFDEICQPPTTGDWTITQDCIMIGDATIDGNVSVESPSLLTIPEGVTLDIDFENQNLTIKSGAGVLIKQGGTIT